MLWGYGYVTLAAFLGFASPGALRQAVYKGRFDPSDLESIFAFKAKRDRRKHKEKP